jgi:hypothetical protein
LAFKIHNLRFSELIRRFRLGNTCAHVELVIVAVEVVEDLAFVIVGGSTDFGYLQIDLLKIDRHQITFLNAYRELDAVFVFDFVLFESLVQIAQR